MSKLRELLELGAGAAIGLLVGLIAGLSISPVTSTILGALSTGLLVLLGFKESQETTYSASHAFRVLGFGLFCSLALIAGISLRTHQVLSPSLARQKQQLTDIGVFTPGEIDRILLSTNFGLAPSTAPDAKDSPKPLVGERESRSSPSRTATSGETAAKDRPGDLASAGLLRAGSAQFCQMARREQFRDVHAYVTELKNIDPRLAHVIESAPVNDQDRLSKSLSEYLCP
jgi:hypothetical protein